MIVIRRHSTIVIGRIGEQSGLVYSNWNLPKEMTDATINIADVPAKVAKVSKTCFPFLI